MGPNSGSSATSPLSSAPGPTALSELSTPDLVQTVLNASYAPTPLAELQGRLGRHAFGEVTSAIRSGGILRRWRAGGFDTKPAVALHRRPAAEEIAQEAVMEALRDLAPEILVPGRWKPAKGSLEAFFTAWSLRQAINVYRRYERALHGEVVAEPATMTESAIYMPGDSGRDPAEIVCERDVARRALDRLTQHQRAAVGRTALGWSDTEISEELGIPEEAVRARISRGRRRLVERFGPEER